MFYFVLTKIDSLQLKETVERIIAVDRAAAMIEEMLKQGQNSQPVFYPDKGVKVVIYCIISLLSSAALFP